MGDNTNKQSNIHEGILAIILIVKVYGNIEIYGWAKNNVMISKKFIKC